MNVWGVTFGGYLAKILSFKSGNLLYKSNFYLLWEGTVACKIMPEKSFLCPILFEVTLAFWNMKSSTLCWFSSTICRRGLNQAAAGMQSAFGSMGQQVQKAAMSAAADAAAKEVTNQLSNALSGGGRRK